MQSHEKPSTFSFQIPKKKPSDDIEEGAPESEERHVGDLGNIEAIDGRANVFIFDEWHKKQAQLHEIVAASNRHGKVPIIADYSMKVGDTRHISFWDDLKRHGLYLIEAKKDKTANILLVNQGFHTNKLFIFNHLNYVIQQHKRYQYKRAGLSDTEDRKEEVIKKDDHSVDAVQYGYRHIKDIQVKGPSYELKIDSSGKTLSDYVMNYRK